MENKSLVDILSAWLTPMVAVAGIGIAFFQCRLAVKKRKDDLFDKRYEFYKKAENGWIATYREDVMEPEVTDLIPLAEEATFLFGKKIGEHILSFAGKKNSNPEFSDEEFVKPFREYLEIK